MKNDKNPITWSFRHSLKNNKKIEYLEKISKDHF